MLHLGMLLPYMRILDKAGKRLASDNYSSLYGLSISNDEKKAFYNTDCRCQYHKTFFASSWTLLQNKLERFSLPSKLRIY